MPEGPEVETVRLGLSSVLGKTILNVKVADHKKYHPLKTNILRLRGYQIQELDRKGKFLLWSFVKGTKRSAAINHLGMTGVWYLFTNTKWSQIKGPFEKYKHYKVYFQLDDGLHLLFVNVRTFGTFQVMSQSEIENLPALVTLGPDILEIPFNNFEFKKRLKGRGKNGRTKEIGKCLLDYSIIAGCGNIYKSEALFEAKINPQIRANQLTEEQVNSLAIALSTVANKALKFKGSTLKDYKHVDGYSGLMQNEFKVYGRSNEPCYECSQLIISAKQGDRTSFWCQNCQKL